MSLCKGRGTSSVPSSSELTFCIKASTGRVGYIQYVVRGGGVRVWGLIRILRVHSSVRETVQDESILRKRFYLSPP
jgi:hypothetical protein